MGALTVRRITAAVAAAVLGAGVAAVPGTAAQAGGKYGPRLVAKLALPTVKAGRATWVKTWWTTRSDVCDVRVTVTGADLAALTYPSNTGSYTSFSRSANLARGDVDYTAVRVTAADDAAGWVTLKVTVSYTKLPAGTLRPLRSADVDCAGDRSLRTTTARMFVRS